MAEDKTQGGGGQGSGGQGSGGQGGGGQGGGGGMSPLDALRQSMHASSDPKPSPQKQATPQAPPQDDYGGSDAHDTFADEEEQQSDESFSIKERLDALLSGYPPAFYVVSGLAVLGLFLFIMTFSYRMGVQSGMEQNAHVPLITSDGSTVRITPVVQPEQPPVPHTDKEIYSLTEDKPESTQQQANTNIPTPAPTTEEKAETAQEEATIADDTAQPASETPESKKSDDVRHNIERIAQEIAQYKAENNDNKQGATQPIKSAEEGKKELLAALTANTKDKTSPSPRNTTTKPTLSSPPEESIKHVAELNVQNSKTHRVQLGSYRQKIQTNNAWLRLLYDHGTLLSSYTPYVEEADLGAKGIFYRLQVGPFSSRTEAKKICEQMKRLGEHCLAIQPNTTSAQKQ